MLSLRAPDVIVAWPATVAQALLRKNGTVPIVFVQSGDPVVAGIVTAWRGRAAMPPDS